MTIYLGTLWLVAAGTALASLMGFWGRVTWLFEWFSHFRVQYSIISALCAPGFLISGHWPGFFFSLGVSTLNLALILPLYLRRRTTSQPLPPTLRILLANILGSNGEYAQIASLLEAEKPDLVLLVEYDYHHDAGLKNVIHCFPHTYLHPRDNNYGLALLSRLPLISAEIILLNNDRNPALVARVEINGRSLTIIGSHPPPPKRKWMTQARDRQILALAALAAKQPGEVILLGDFNTTSWSPIFSDLLRASGLRDSRVGFGVQPTWPAGLPLLRIPIDHVVHTPGIQIAQRHTGLAGGSDHHPVIVDFYLAGPGESAN